MMNSPCTIKNPPMIASKFLSWALPGELIAPVLGDLSEEYQQRISTNQIFSANYWYYRQAIKSGAQFMLKTQRGFIMFIFSILLFLGLTFFAVITAGSTSMYIDMPSVLVIFPPAFAFTYASTSHKNVQQAFKLLITNESNHDIQIYKYSKRVFSVLGNSGILLGIFMTIIGWVAMADLSEDMTNFGPAFSLSILTLLYGIGLKMLCYVAEQKIKTLSEG